MYVAWRMVLEPIALIDCVVMYVGIIEGVEFDEEGARVCCTVNNAAQMRHSDVVIVKCYLSYLLYLSQKDKILAR